jgi:hypothetical protein
LRGVTVVGLVDARSPADHVQVKNVKKKAAIRQPPHHGQAKSSHRDMSDLIRECVAAILEGQSPTTDQHESKYDEGVHNSLVAHGRHPRKLNN